MASPLLHDEGEGVSSSIDIAEIRTAAPGLGFPRLTGSSTSPLGWPAPDRVSRETSTSAPSAEQQAGTPSPVAPPNESVEPVPPERDPSQQTAPVTPAGTREDRMDAPTHDDTEVRAQIAAA